jgi:hypothetical protein
MAEKIGYIPQSVQTSERNSSRTPGKLKKIVAGVTALAAVGCSNADTAGISSWGEPALVQKFSGGKLVAAGVSTGKVENEGSSDGYIFGDKCNDRKLARFSGDVVITYPTPLPSCDEVLSKISLPDTFYGLNGNIESNGNRAVFI